MPGRMNSFYSCDFKIFGLTKCAKVLTAGSYFQNSAVLLTFDAPDDAVPARLHSDTRHIKHFLEDCRV